MEAMQDAMENRRQHEAGGDDDDETGQDRVGAGKDVFNSPKGPIPDRIIAAFT